MKYHLIRKEDCLKTNWYIWECTQETDKGALLNGYIQADFSGNMIAEDTFEPMEL